MGGLCDACRISNLFAKNQGSDLGSDPFLYYLVHTSGSYEPGEQYSILYGSTTIIQ